MDQHDGPTRFARALLIASACIADAGGKRRVWQQPLPNHIGQCACCALCSAQYGWLFAVFDFYQRASHWLSTDRYLLRALHHCARSVSFPAVLYRYQRIHPYPTDVGESGGYDCKPATMRIGVACTCTVRLGCC